MKYRRQTAERKKQPVEGCDSLPPNSAVDTYSSLGACELAGWAMITQRGS